MRLAIITLVAVFAGVACNQNDFAGAANRAAGQSKPNDDGDGEGPSLGNKSKVDKSDKKDASKNPGDDGGDGKPTTPTDNTNIGSDPNIVDIINGLFGSDSDIVPNQPDENTIDFGNDRFFHIGDNQLTATTCKAEVTQAVLAGTQFYFEFEVKKDSTDISLEISRVCGVDYGDSNEVRIIKVTNATEITKQIIPAGDAPIRVAGTGLGVGKYMVIVESLVNNSEGRPDHDDYLVGGVKLKATKPIKAGRVGAK